jgi:hypothetical protein
LAKFACYDVLIYGSLGSRYGDAKGSPC